MVQSLNWPGIVAAVKALYRPKLLRPTFSVADLGDVDWHELYHQEKIEVVCFDKDNCLTLPYATQLHEPIRPALERCIHVFGRERVAIISNSAGGPDDNPPHYPEARNLEQLLGIEVIRHERKKPSCGQDILSAFARIPAARIAVVGDRLLTDIVMANMYGMKSIFLTKPLCIKGDNPAAIWIRRLEHWWMKRLGD